VTSLIAVETVLALDHVGMTYTSEPPVHALRGVDLTVRQGELLAVVGPSGSGKSTLLHIMGTLDRPTAGEVTVAGHDVSKLSDRQLSALRARHIGFVFQQFHLLSGYTALDNVADGLLYTGIGVRQRRAIAAETLEMVGLGHRLEHAATKLSGGESQRVAIARALVGQPAIILADEPTGNLDTRTGESIIGLMEELNRQGSTLIVITHDKDIADRFPRSVELRDGEIVHDSAEGLR
jgi:putative ABC transport system ATP-binding protein